MFIIYLEEIPQYPFTYNTTFLGVELAGVEIILVHGSTIGLDVVCYRNGLTTQRYIIAVNEIDIRGVLMLLKRDRRKYAFI